MFPLFVVCVFPSIKIHWYVYIPVPPVAVAWKFTFSGVFPLVGLAVHVPVIVTGVFVVIVGQFVVYVCPCVFVPVTVVVYVPWLLYVCVVVLSVVSCVFPSLNVQW